MIIVSSFIPNIHFMSDTVSFIKASFARVMLVGLLAQLLTVNPAAAAASGLFVSLASVPAPGSNVYVREANDVPFAGIVFTCEEADECYVSDITLQGYFDDEGNADDFDSTYDAVDHATPLVGIVPYLWLEDADGNWVTSPEAIHSTTQKVHFDNFTWNVEEGETQALYVMGDISSLGFANGNPENIAFALINGDDVTAENGDGAMIEVTGTANESITTYVTVRALWPRLPLTCH